MVEELRVSELEDIINKRLAKLLKRLETEELSIDLEIKLLEFLYGFLKL